MRKALILIAIAVLATGGVASAGTVYVDTFEDITDADGMAVSSRIIGGVTVTIRPASYVELNGGGVDGALEVATYDSMDKGWGFWGVGNWDNRGPSGSEPWNKPINDGAPAVPGGVDYAFGTRFLTGYADNTLMTLSAGTPLVFLFSSPVQSFGLTTLDVLESTQTSDTGDAPEVSFEAFDAGTGSLALQTRSGIQGNGGRDSGLDLNWFVTSPNADISRVVMSSNFNTGYGIDNLAIVLPVSISPFNTNVIANPLPSAVWLGLGMLGALGVARRFRRKLSQN